MKTTALVVGTILLIGGFCGFGWLFPFFTLNEPYLTWYGELLFGPSFSRPGGAGAAAPFLWIITAPVGLLAAMAGATLVAWAKGR